MVQAVVHIDEHANRVLNIVKAKFGLKDKSEVLNLVITEYEENFLEPELRPEYLEKLEKIRKGKYVSYHSIDELRKATSWKEARMYRFKISEHLQDLLKKLAKRDKQAYEQVLNKIKEIVEGEAIEHYKNLRYNMKDSKRVYIGHFVLIFQYDKNKNEINFDDFDHHDNVYKR